MMAVGVTTQPNFSAAKPTVLFQGQYTTDALVNRNYDVAADGQRFLMIRPSDEEARATQINGALNWAEELKRGVGPVKE
jgi:hypothetical protein